MAGVSERSTSDGKLGSGEEDERKGQQVGDERVAGVERCLVMRQRLLASTGEQHDDERTATAIKLQANERMIRSSRGSGAKDGTGQHEPALDMRNVVRDVERESLA